MNLSKTPLKTTDRLLFTGTAPQGTTIQGYFSRIFKKSLQIKSGGQWRNVNQILVSRVQK